MHNLTQFEIQKRILELKEFVPDANGLSHIVKSNEIMSINDIVNAIKNLVAAEKLENRGSPTNPIYKVIERHEISLSKFFKNMREIDGTTKLD